MADGNGGRLKRRTDRELRFLSFNEKLRYIAFAVLGLPLLVAVNIVFILHLIDVFRPNTGTGFAVAAGFALVVGIGALGADFWILRWLKEEFQYYRWAGSSDDD